METLPPHRVGSPFAAEPLACKPLRPEPESPGGGVWEQTAAAAATAALILLGFALGCWAYFPAGGLAVTGLGAVVALLGLSSGRGRLAAAALALHGLLFFACYLRVL